MHAAVTDLLGQLGHSDLNTTQQYAKMVDERCTASVLALQLKRKPEKGSPEMMGDSQGDSAGTDGSGSVHEDAA